MWNDVDCCRLMYTDWLLVSFKFFGGNMPAGLPQNSKRPSVPEVKSSKRKQRLDQSKDKEFEAGLEQAVLLNHPEAALKKPRTK